MEREGVKNSIPKDFVTILNFLGVAGLKCAIFMQLFVETMFQFFHVPHFVQLEPSKKLKNFNIFNKNFAAPIFLEKNF